MTNINLKNFNIYVAEGSDLTTSDITSEPIDIIRKTSYNAAMELAEDTDVVTSAGNILHAKKGDYLVCSVKEENGRIVPDDEYGYWTINREVFNNTNWLYRYHATYFKETIIKLGKTYKDCERHQSGFIYDVLRDFYDNCKNRNENTFVCINGYMFYSDDQITAEEGYYRMSGETIEEYWKRNEEWRKKVRQEEEEFERNLPKMIQNYLIKGSEIIEEQYLKNWQKCVECRVRDMYKGKDLDMSLKIIDLLNKNTPLNEIKKEFDEQNHTGWSRAICLSIIKDFCNKGEIFYNYIQ